MGLVILPVMILWLVAAVYTVRMGYQLLSIQPFMTFGLPMIVVALLCISIYIYLGLASFKDNKEIWAFDIPFFFMTNKIVLTVFSLSALTHFFWGNQIQNPLLLAGLFVVMMTLSSGALIGSFSADSYIQKHNIKVTY